MISSIRQLFVDRKFWGVASIFFVLSVLFSFWLTYIPYVKDALGLTEGQLGLALFAMPVGLLLAMFVSGWLNQRFGEGAITLIGIITYAVVIPLPVIAPNLYLLYAALFLTGFTSGLTDIAMNALADTLEKRHKVYIMAACHGFFSMGGMVGALIGGGILSLGTIRPIHHMIAGSILIILILWVMGVFHSLSQVRSQQQKDEKVFVLPKGVLLGLSLLAFATMLGEGAVADWSAIYIEHLIDHKGGLITMGYAAFSLLMTIGRLYGDKLIFELGRRRIIIGGNVVGLLGVTLLWLGNPYAAIAGFACMGIGYSCIVPVLFSSAAESTEVTAAAGIASVASIGYAGFLIGPVAIGYIAEEFSLRIGWGFIAGLMLISLLYATQAFQEPKSS